MSIFADFKTYFQTHEDLEQIEVWMDKCPADKESIYPRCIVTMLPSSGRITDTFDATSYENVDLRVEIFDKGDVSIHDYRAAIHEHFAKTGFTLSEGRMGTLKRTGSYVRYAGRDTNRNEIYQAVVTFKFIIQNN